MWIFKKRAFSVSRGFSELIKKALCKMKPLCQVDLKGNSIYRWVPVGFWAGSLDVCL